MELVREIEEDYVIHDKKDTDKYLNEFKKEDREFFIVLGLDTANKVLYREVVSVGTLNSTLIDIRGVFKSAIMKSANTIIIAHNHPSGNLKASHEDILVLEKLKKASYILDIKILDALIISSKGIESYIEEV